MGSGGSHTLRIERASETGLSFDVLIDSKKCGEATLWINNSTHLPVSREQSIWLDGKKVETVEDYSNFIATA